MHGWRVVLVRDVERFPHFIARRGASGVVVECSATTARVRMDVHLPGAEEWDNEVVWHYDRADFAHDVMTVE